MAKLQNKSVPGPCRPGPHRKACKAALLGGEAIEQPVAAGAAQVGLATAAIGPARGMRWIPRPRCRIVAQSFAVDMANHGCALGAARPVATGAIVTGRKSATFRG